MKKILLLFIIILTCGCTNFNELEDLAIVSSVYIDRISNEYDIGIEILNGEKSQNGSSISTYIVSSKCQNIDNCFNNITNKLSKTIYLAHTQLIIVNEEMINYGIEHIMDYIIRNPDFRTTMNMVITKDNSKDLYSHNYIEKITSNQIVNTLNEVNLDNNTLDTFLVNNFIKGSTSYLANIINIDDEIVINGLTIFNEFKPIKTINEYHEYLLLTNQLRKNNIEIKCNDNNLISFEVINNKVITNLNKDKVIFNINMELKIIDNKCNYNLRSNKELTKLINDVNKSYKNKLNNYLKDLNLNILGIEHMYYQKYKVYKNINDYEINVSVSIGKKGLLTEGLFKGEK